MDWIKVVIIDDEFRARENLKLKISSLKLDIEIVGESDCVEDGLLCIKDNSPDLVFLDIAMPRQSGFDLIRQLSKIDFEVIFVTAFDTHAIKAFEHNAIGYILKPIDNEKLETAISNAIDKIDLKRGSDRIDALLKHLDKPKQSITVNTTESIEIRDEEEVIRFESDGGYTHIYLADGSKLYSSVSIGSYETQLMLSKFMRVHRSHLINLKYFRSYLKSGTIMLKDGAQVPLSKRKKTEFLKLIS